MEQHKGGRGRKIAIGNWKLHMTLAQTRDYFTVWNDLILPQQVQIGFAVPFTALALASTLCQPHQEAGFQLGGEVGAQDCAPYERGAFTGEVSAEMIQEAGGSFVILGHSERRRLFAETDAMVREKVRCAALRGLAVVLCCGETQQERDAGRSIEVVTRQLELALEDIEQIDLRVAYEPVWAIGSGEAASPENLMPVVEGLQRWLRARYEKEVPILYGGSVTPQNAGVLGAVPHVAGILVGGPSTDPVLFHQVVCALAERSAL
jgi:triosephosphate isomerase